MNRNLLVILFLVVGFFTAAGISSYRHFNNVDAQLERELDATRLARDYAERAGWLRVIPDEKAYLSEVPNFFRWYFKEVDRHVARFHLNKNFDDYLAELDKRGGKDEAKGSNRSDRQLAAVYEKKAGSIAEKREAFEFEKKLFDLFRSGSYKPAWTGTDKGMRLDIVSADVAMVNGKPKVRFALALWGPQRELVEDETKGLRRMKTDVNFSSNWKLFDAKGKLYGEINGGNPALRNDFPERLIPMFPPQMVLGHYDLDLVPAVVDHMEISFNVTSHSPSGGAAEAVYTWKLATPGEWKLRPGEAWEGATDSVRSQEEIDPNTGAGKAKKEARK